MDAAGSITSQRLTRKRKRKSNGHHAGTSNDGTTTHQESGGYVSILKASSRSSVPSLLDLPKELLVEIFLLSANSALPETCLFLYDALFANPKHNSQNVGPPMWLQVKFVHNTNPTISFAVEKCLRRRFFGAETFKAFLPELKSTNSLERLTVPLRCLVRHTIHTRELLLYAELFLNEIRLTRRSRDKALIYRCKHYSHVDCNSPFWRSSLEYEFSRSAVLQAYICAVKGKFYDANPGTFEALVYRFGLEDDIGQSLYDYAALHHDQQLISVLQRHGVRPGMAALQKLMNAK